MFGKPGRVSFFFFKTETGNRLAGFIFKKIKIDGFLKSKTVARGRFLFTEKQKKRARDRGGRGGRGLRVATLFATQSQATVTHRYEWFFRRSPGVLTTFSRKWCVAFFKSLEHQFSVSPPRFERTSNPVWRH